MIKHTRHVMINLNLGQDHFEEEISKNGGVMAHKVNKTCIDNQLESPHKASHSLTQNLSYKNNIGGAKSPNNRSVNNRKSQRS